MDRYIGLDVHAQTTTLAVMSAKGKHVAEKVVETHGKLLVETMAAIAGDKHVCLEEGMHAEWIHELLSHHVAEIVVTIPPERSGSKSDARDAWWLANQLRLGVPQKKVFKSKLTGLREAVRAHQAFTKHSTRAKLQMRFLARGRGLTVDRAQLLKEKERNELIGQLPPERRARARLHAEFVDHAEQWRQQALEQLEQQARRCPDVLRLLDVPGLGVVRAAQIVAAIITPHRFRAREQLWSYCGLAIVTRSSSDWRPTRGGQMVRSGRALPRGLAPGNSTLKCAFKGAARDVVRRHPEHPWAVAFQRAVDGGQRTNLARLTLARKIAETVLHIWKHKEAYDPTKHKIQAAA
jgi:transposase